MIEVGQQAPEFDAIDQDGNRHRLRDYRGRPVVLYFYPRDDTPGCTKQACGLRDSKADWVRADAVVLGVSRDDQKSHAKFASKFDLNFPLLVDDGKITEDYGTWVEKNMYGRRYMGIQRATFLIGPDGIVANVWPKVKPADHATDVLEALAALG